MRRFGMFSATLLLLAVTFGCTFLPQQNSHKATTIDGDRVGLLRKGDMTQRLYDGYGKSNVKILVDQRDSVEQDSRNYYVYDGGTELLFVAIAPTHGDEKNLIENINIRSVKMSTVEGVNIDSNVEQIRTTYPDARVIQNGDKIFIYIASSELYFEINPVDVKSYSANFIAEIPIDSICGDAVALNMSVNWYAQPSDVLTMRYWREALRFAMSWFIKVLPPLIGQTLFIILLLQLLRALIKRVKKLVVKHAERDAEVDTEEAEKRVNTMAGILNGILSIVAWSTVVLIILSHLDISVGPILASAGVVGIAIGFGAQELVRDFISGFFILMENQLRAGDIAIIDGTQGLVEKIELRTITLRDVSGVVHIFQNGKINTLSNMTKEWSAMILDIGVAYKEDVDFVMELMQKVGSEMRATPDYGCYMLADVEMLGLDNFGDSAIVIRVILKTRPMKQWIVKREYQRRLKIAFDREGVEIPFNQVTIHRPAEGSPAADANKAEGCCSGENSEN